MKTLSGEMRSSESAKPMAMSMMMKQAGARRIVIAVAVVVVGGIGWYLFRPELLFVNKTVNEALPASTAATPASVGAPESRTLATGMFHSGAHETKGMATIHELASGKRVLRLTGFETSNGPDVHVYLVAAKDVTDNDTVKSAGFVDLGSLKGNLGDQNYDVPADLDLNKYRAATIWCARFGVNFGTAALGKGESATASGKPVSLLAGMFHSGAHETKGTAAIHELGAGRRVLRLTGFETSNGPDVHVYLVAAKDVTDNDTVKSAGFVDLGSMKGNIGDQNYDVPADLDLNKYRAATIWCARFGVNFGTAPLN